MKPVKEESEISKIPIISPLADGTDYTDIMRCINCKHYQPQNKERPCAADPAKRITDPESQLCSFWEPKEGVTLEDLYRKGDKEKKAAKLKEEYPPPHIVDRFKGSDGRYYAVIDRWQLNWFLEGYEYTYQQDIDSAEFRAFYTQHLWNKKKEAMINTGKPLRTPSIPSPTEVNTAVSLLKNQIEEEGEEVELGLGAVKDKAGNIIIDTYSYDWRAIIIRKDGTIGHGTGTRVFRRNNGYREFKYQVPVVMSAERSRKRLEEFVEKFTRVTDDADRHLILIDIVVSLIPDIPKPILLLYGDQGSTKTTTMKFIKQLLQPSIVKILGAIPDKYEELVRVLSQNYVCFFDNITKINQTQSDTLARAVTDTGMQVRQLYTDNKMINYNFKHKIGLNGINIPGHNPDFLDRCLIIRLERLRHYKPMSTLEAEFERDVDAYRGAVIQLISYGYMIYDEVKAELEERKVLSRMADYAAWGEAVSRAAGYPKDRFLLEYSAKMRGVNREAIEGDMVATLLMQVLEQNEGFEGAPSLLNRMIIDKADEEGMSTARLPSSPVWMTRKLNVLKVNLMEEGWMVEFLRVHGNRIVRISRANNDDSGEAGDAGSGGFGGGKVDEEDVVRG